ncbi:MAG: hypothetical protein WC635_09430 [Bacteriovorax sp.]
MYTTNSFLKKTLRNESGIALLMVMGVIAILTFLLADFTFETKLNKIKIYNQQDKIQARLNAESGLNFALAKLRLYQEGRNKIEKDENLKNAFPSSDLESIIIQPFVFPIPVSAKANIIQRTAADDFLKKIIFHGELSVTFTKISGFLNPNALRILSKTEGQGTEQDMAGALTGQEQDSAEAGQTGADGKVNPGTAAQIIEKKLTETLQRLIKDKNDNDEDFHQRYSNVDAQYLVKELQFYVNDKGMFQDASRPEIEAKFSQKNITPKFAPMSSIDELYMLPSWDDALVDLIKDRMSVHDVSVIAVNELTTEDLKILFPAINNIQTEEFFKYRDGDVDKKIKGRKFKDGSDFKKVITGELNIVTEAEYDERMAALKSAGLVIDTAGKLYKISSRGSMNNAIYNLVAYVDLPIKPQPKKAPKPTGSTPPPADDQSNPDTGEPAPPGPDGKSEKPVPTELLNPRVVEVRLE